MIYKVQGLIYRSERDAIDDAQSIAKKIKLDSDYVLIMKSTDFGFMPYMRVFKHRTQFIKCSPPETLRR